MSCPRCGAVVVIGGAPAASAAAKVAPSAAPRPVAAIDVERSGQGCTIVTRCAEKLAPFVAPFVDRFLAEARVEPAAFSWWGPAPVFLREEGPRRFRFCEPDLRLQQPMSRAREDVSNVLIVALLIGSITQAAGVRPENFRILDVMLTFRGALDMRRAFLHRRFAPRPIDATVTDTGWYLGPDPALLAKMSDAEVDARENYKTERIWELYYRRPMAVAAMAMPADYVAHLDGDELLAIVDPDNRPVWRPDPSRPLF